jgi:dipeptidase E
MKLFLASQGIPDIKALHELVGKAPAETHVVMIANAFDNAEPIKRSKYLSVSRQALERAGYRAREIDLRNYHDSPDIAAELDRTDLIWVTGGNTFYLRYLAKMSGLEKALPHYLARGVYGGESAGAVLMGETLHGIEILDDPKESPEVFHDALGIVDFSVIPHWQTASYQKWLQDCYDEMKTYTREVVTLTDRQAIIIDGEERRLVEASR